MYLNDLFAVNIGSHNRKVKMLLQPKYNSKYGGNCSRHQSPSLWNRVDNKIISLSLLQSLMSGPWCVRVLSATCVP